MCLSTLEPLRGENAVGSCPQREIKVPFRGFLSKFLTRTLVHVLTVPLKFRTLVHVLTVPLKFRLTLDTWSSRESRIENRVENWDSILHNQFSQVSPKQKILDYTYLIFVSRKRFTPRRKNDNRFCTCRPKKPTKGCKRCDRIMCRSVSLNEINLWRECVWSQVKLNNLLISSTELNRVENQDSIESVNLH